MHLQTAEFKFYDFFLLLDEIILYINSIDLKNPAFQQISTNKIF